MSPINVVRLFAALLAESHVVLVSDSVERVARCVETARATLYPFAWPHLYIPILPRSLLDYVTAPMPFLLGLPSSAYLSAFDDDAAMPVEDNVYVYSLDRRRWLRPPPAFNGGDDGDATAAEAAGDGDNGGGGGGGGDAFALFGALPAAHTLERRLSHIVSSSSSRAASRGGRLFDQAAARAFMHFFVDVCGAYRRYLGVGPAPAHRNVPHFAADAFVADATQPATRAFLQRHFMHTQMWSAFLFERETMLRAGISLDDAGAFEAARRSGLVDGATFSVTRAAMCSRCCLEHAPDHDWALMKGELVCSTCFSARDARAKRLAAAVHRLAGDGSHSLSALRQRVATRAKAVKAAAVERVRSAAAHGKQLRASAAASSSSSAAPPLASSSSSSLTSSAPRGAAARSAAIASRAAADNDYDNDDDDDDDYDDDDDDYDTPSVPIASSGGGGARPCTVCARGDDAAFERRGGVVALCVACEAQRQRRAAFGASAPPPRSQRSSSSSSSSESLFDAPPTLAAPKPLPPVVPPKKKPPQRKPPPVPPKKRA